MRFATIDSLEQAWNRAKWLFGYMKTLSSANTLTAMYILLRVMQKLTPVLIGLRSRQFISSDENAIFNLDLQSQRFYVVCSID